MISATANASTGCDAINSNVLNHNSVFTSSALTSTTAKDSDGSGESYNYVRTNLTFNDTGFGVDHFAPNDTTAYAFSANDVINYTATLSGKAGGSSSTFRIYMRSSTNNTTTTNVFGGATPSTTLTNDGSDSRSYTVPSGMTAVGFRINSFNSNGAPSGTVTISVTCTPAPVAPTLSSFTYGSTVGYNPGSTTATNINVSTGGNATNTPTGYTVSNASGGTYGASSATSGGGTVTISSSGVASYTPRVGYRGNDTFFAIASNSGGNSSPATVTVSVGNPTITASLTGTNAKVGTALSGYSVTPSGGNAPYSCALNGGSAALPGGVTLNSNCTLSGTPTTPGTYAFNVDVADSSVTGANGGTASAFTQTNLAITNFVITQDAPTVTAVAPAVGPTAGSTSVVLTGTNFYNVTGVSFGATAATGFVRDSATQITVPSPAHAAGAVNVTVTTSGGTSATAAQNLFTYSVTPNAPVAVTPANGSTIGTTTPNYTGTADASMTITVYVDGSSVGTTTSDGAGNWTKTQPTGLTAAAHTVRATATNADGLVSPNSNTNTFTVTPTPVASSFTASAVAYNASGVTFSVAGHATNSPTNYAVGSATTAQGGSVSIDSAGLVTYTAPTGFRGNDSFTFTATNNGGTSSPATVTVPVNNPTLVTSLAGSGTRGTALSGVQINVSGGRASYTCSTTLASGALPSGTQLNPDCTISGTPAASGTFTFTATITDSSLGTGPFTQTSSSLTLSVAAPTLSMTPASGTLPGATVATAYSQSFTASGGTAAYSYAITNGAVPTGTTLSGGGALTGTPTAAGTFNFDVTATDASTGGSGGPYTVTHSYSVAVSKGTQTINFGALSNASLSASPLTLSATATSGLTVGFASTTTGVCTVSGTTLTLLATGTCSITASQAGNANWIAASDVVQSFTVTPATLTITQNPATGLKVGAAYSQANPASGGVAPYTYSLSAGAFVPGTTVNSSTGTVSGTPTVAGSFSYIIRATDSQPLTADTPVTTVTIAKGDQTISFTAPPTTVLSDPSPTLGATTNSPLSISYVSNSTGICTVSGNTVTLVATGTCSITASQAGDSNWNAASSVTRTFTVAPATLVVTPAAPSSATKVGVAYGQDNPASGGVAPYTYALASGALPAGTSLNASTGTVSGTPTAAGSFTYAIRATDSQGTPVTATGSNVNVTIAKGDQTISFTGPANQQLSAGSPTLSATTTSALTITYVSNSTGVCTVSGNTVTLVATGTCSITARQLGDANWNAATDVTRTFNVTPDTLTIAQNAATGLKVGAAYSQANPASGGVAPYTYSLSAGAFVPGTTVSSATGTVSGMPTVAGSFSYIIRVTDSQPVTADTPVTTVTIAKGDQTITFGALGPASLSASPLTLSATTTSPLTVAFASTTTGICTVSGNSVTLLATGTCSITASQAGDTNWNPASDVVRSFTVTPATLAVTPAASASTEVGVAYSQANPATGGVAPYTYALASGTLPAGTTLNTADGTVSGTPTAAGAFSYAIKATDSQGTPVTATGATVTGTIAKGSQAITFASLADASLSASPLTLSATTTSPLTVSFTSTTTSICTVSGTTLTLLQIGTCSVTASQAGDANWDPATDVIRSFTVTPANLVITNNAASGLAVGASYTQTNPASGGIAPYTYTLGAGAFVPGTTVDSSTGTVSGTPTVAGSFSYIIRATDSQGTPVHADTPVITVNIAKGTQTLSFTSTAPTGVGVGGAPYTVAAAASSGLGVTFSLDGASTGCALSGNTVTFVSTGTCRIDANQAGDSNWNAAAQVQQSFAVNAASPITATVSFAPSTLGVGASGTATITFANPNASASPSIAPLLTGSALLSRTGLGGSCGASGADAGANFQFNGFSIPSGSCTVTLTYTSTTAGSSSGVVLGAFTPSGYPTTSATSSNSFAVTPTVTGISPPSGPVSQVVTISGTGFSTTPGNNSVAFGASPGTVTAASATSLTVTAPAVGSGAVNVTVTVNGQASPVPASFTFIDKPVTAAKSGVAVPYNSTGTAIDLSSSISGGPHSSIAIGTAPTHGTASISGDEVTYTPAAGYFGADSFTYTATGAGGTSNVSTVDLTVATPVAPTAAAKSGVAVPYASTGTAIDLSASITGVHSSIAIGTAPAHGTVTVSGDVATYTPAATYYGADSFTYTATGPGGTSSPATVSLTVANPPAPVAADKNGVAVPYESSGTVIDLSGSITGVHSAVVIGTAPAHGTVTIAGDVVTYKPAATYYGADSFTYTATGPGGTSAPATVNVTVATPGAPVGAARSGVAVPYNSPGTAIDLSTSVTGVHSTLTISTAPTHGSTTVNGDVVTYVPTTGYFGADSFGYTVTGPGGTSSAAVVSLTVATPPPPSAQAGTSTVGGSTTTTGTSVQINLSSLVTGVYNTIQIASQPAHGTVTLSGGAGPLPGQVAAPVSPYIATYTPTVGFVGTDSFTFTATGPGGTSAPGTVTITVVGQVPIATPKTATAGDGQMVSVMLTDGAQRGPFTGATVVSVSPANMASTAVVAAAGGYRLDVTPNNRFGGTIVVTYTLTNAYGVSDPSTVTLTVQARPDPRNDPNVGAISDAQSEATRRFARAQVSNFMRRTEQLHNGGGSTGMAMGVTLASRDGSAPMQRPDDKNWGMAITERMRMSGEDPALGQMANQPNSPFSRSTQLGYDRNVMTSGAGVVGGGTAGGKAAAPGKAAQDDEGDGTRRIGSVATWAGGAIEIGTRDKTTDRSKVTATSAGLSAGADIKLAEGVVVGVGGGYGTDNSEIGTNARVRSSSTLYAAYASLQPANGMFVDGVVGRGQLDFTTRRLAAAVDANARGSRDGSFTVAAVSLGIDRSGGGLQWSIYGRGEYLDAQLDAYSETGAGRYNLRFDARDVRSVTGTLGARFEYRQKVSFGSVIPRVRAEWNHEFADVDAQWLDYADIPGAAAYSLAGNGWKREQLQLSIGTRFDILRGGWSFDVETGLRTGQGEKAGTLQLRLSKQF
jgi:uncharacterized protein YhjY with autotransporter beta-barrel domain